MPVANIAAQFTTISIKVSGSFVQIGAVTNMTGPGCEQGTRDLTTLSSTWKEFAGTGIPDAGEFTFTVLYTYANHGYVASTFGQSTNNTWMLAYPNGDSFTCDAATVGFDFPEIEPGSTVTAVIKLKFSGAPIWN